MYTSIKAEQIAYGIWEFTNLITGRAITEYGFHRSFINTIISISDHKKTEKDIHKIDEKSNLVILIMDDTLDQIKECKQYFNSDFYMAMDRIGRIIYSTITPNSRGVVYIHNMEVKHCQLCTDIDILLGGTARTEMTVKVRI